MISRMPVLGDLTQRLNLDHGEFSGQGACEKTPVYKPGVQADPMLL